MLPVKSFCPTQKRRVSWDVIVTSNSDHVQMVKFTWSEVYTYKGRLNMTNIKTEQDTNTEKNTNEPLEK